MTLNRNKRKTYQTTNVLVPCPLTIKEANEFVARFHRHNTPTSGGKFAVGVILDGQLRGAAICGRPIARLLDDGETLEITRVATDGTRNACSFLYSRCLKIARLMGYGRVITYTLTEECGASLRAIGARVVGKVAGGGWSCPNRKRKSQEVYNKQKWRWEIGPKQEQAEERSQEGSRSREADGRSETPNSRQEHT